MKIFKLMVVGLLTGFISLSAMAHDPRGESFTLSGKVTSVELTDDGGVITVSAEAGRYGKVFLTYNVKLNPALPNQGYFSGRGIGIDDEGNREAGSRQGVFRREGSIMSFYSLDDVSDCRLNFCETTINL